MYFLLACADDTKVVTEDDEGNNCLASAGVVTVTLPDLVEQSVRPGRPVPAWRQVHRVGHRAQWLARADAGLDDDAVLPLG